MIDEWYESVGELRNNFTLIKGFRLKETSSLQASFFVSLSEGVLRIKRNLVEVAGVEPASEGA